MCFSYKVGCVFYFTKTKENQKLIIIHTVAAVTFAGAVDSLELGVGRLHFGVARLDVLANRHEQIVQLVGLLVQKPGPAGLLFRDILFEGAVQLTL